MKKTMNHLTITIVIVPREQFSKTQASLESIFEHTRLPFTLIYVDGNAPPPVRRYLERQVAEKGFRLIREDRYLSANVARNLAVPHLKTKYTVFMDNDVIVSPNWLEPLVDCANETDCWVVGPFYCVGDLGDPVIHTMGADHGIDEVHGKRHWRERHFYCGQKLNAVRGELHRRPIDLVEFHCLLMRTEVFERLGAFDEALLSYFDHNDLCLQVRNSGGAIYVEPRSLVTYIAPPPFAISDVPYFLLRWSNRWIDASVAHFTRKHGIDATDPVFAAHYDYQQAQRARLLRHPRGMVRRMLGNRGVLLMESAIDRILGWTVTARA
jgi:GT2 family glycosyltransferase